MKMSLHAVVLSVETGAVIEGDSREEIEDAIKRFLVGEVPFGFWVHKVALVPAPEDAPSVDIEELMGRNGADKLDHAMWYSREPKAINFEMLGITH